MSKFARCSVVFDIPVGNFGIGYGKTIQDRIFNLVSTKIFEAIGELSTGTLSLQDGQNFSVQLLKRVLVDVQVKEED